MLEMRPLSSDIPSRHDIVGVVLAGGLSRRMGGGDKSLASLAGRPMIARVLETLAPQVTSTVINANGDHRRFADFGCKVIADSVPGFLGPLAGILTGMQWAIEHAPQARFVVTVSADAPFIPGDLVAKLAAEAGGLNPVLARCGDDLHTVIGLWPVALARKLSEALRQGERKVRVWAEAQGALHVSFAPTFVGAGGIDPFFNVNTPQDLAEAERIFAQLQTSSGAPYAAMAHARGRKPAVMGVVGWKNAGKTTLVVRLVEALVQGGWRVATLKHTHHRAVHDERTIDGFPPDSARHRAAGALCTALVGPSGMLIDGRSVSDQDLGLEDALVLMSDHMRGSAQAGASRAWPCDFILVEGFKSAGLAKIEVRDGAPSLDRPAFADKDPRVIAVVSAQLGVQSTVPWFHRDDIAGLVGFVLNHAELVRGDDLPRHSLQAD